MDRDPGPTSLLALQESLFPARVVYDLLFFFIVIIIVLNLIFGVIIDTFADLRSEKQKKEEILKTTCFICGEACCRPQAPGPGRPWLRHGLGRGSLHCRSLGPEPLGNPGLG